MSSKNFNYKDVLSRILICPTDNRTTSATNFWKKETMFFKKLFKKYSNETFWSHLSLIDCPCKNGRIPSLALFFDKKNKMWAKILEKKWKLFNWVPPKIKSYKFKKDCDLKIKYSKKKKSIRDFLG